MKTLNISFDLYLEEMRREYAKGYIAAMLNAKHVAEEFSAGKSQENLISDHCDENCEVDFVNALFKGQSND